MSEKEQDFEDELEEDDVLDDEIEDDELEEIEDKPVSETAPKVPKKVLMVCQKCDKPIYNEDDIKHYSVRVYHGRASSIEHYTVCKDCYKKHQQAVKAKEEKKQNDYNAELKKRLIKSLTWPFLIAAVAAVAGAFIGGAIAAVLVGVGSFAFSACLFLGNNFVEDLWLAIATWSIHLPGLIFDLSLDGLILFLVVKIVLAVLGVIFGILLVILATLLAMVVSIFVYPFALVKNIRKVPDQLY